MNMTKFTAALVPRLGSEKGGFGFASLPGILYDEYLSITRAPADYGSGGAGHDRDPDLVSSHRVQNVRAVLARNVAVLVGAAALGPALEAIRCTSLLLAEAAAAQLQYAALQHRWKEQQQQRKAPAPTPPSPAPARPTSPKPPAPRKRSSPFEFALQAAVDTTDPQPSLKRSRSASPLPTAAPPAPDAHTAPASLPSRYLDATHLPLASLNISLGPQLGAGAHGTVYSGTWEGQAAAIKLPNIAHHLASGTPSEADGSLAREATLLPTLKHPNIVACLHAVGPGGNNSAGAPAQPLLVMELLPLGSLDDLLHDGPHAAATRRSLLPHVLRRHGAPQHAGAGPRADRVVHLSLLRDSAAALQHLHSLPAPVVHRDLKPENVLLSADGTAKLSDFGLAVVLGSDAYAAAADVFGTVQYAAPEELWGGNQHSTHAKCDVFALGCMLWEVLSGQRPWQGLDTVQVMYGVGNEGRRLPVDAAWPADLVSLMHGCWAADPEARPSAGHAVAVLEAHIGALVRQL